MGRLGFNIVGQKEAAKNVEAGVPDYQQNEKNESAEMSELLASIEAKNKTIFRLRGLSIFLTLVVIFTIVLLVIFGQPTQEKCSEFKEDRAVLKKVFQEFDLNPMEATFLNDYLNGPREEMTEVASLIALQMGGSDYTRKGGKQLQAEQEKPQQELKDQKSRADELALEASEKYSLLQKQQEALKAQFARKEEELQDEIKTLQKQCTDLVEKLEASNSKLQQLQQQQQQQRNSRQQQQTVKPTTTAAPKGLFDNNQLKKLNDLVRDIETVGRIFTNVFMDAI